MPRYQLSIRAEKLPRGIFRRPNPYAKVTVTGGPREGETIGKTEVMENTQDPDFIKAVFIVTDASVYLPIRIAIYNDRDQSCLTEAVFEATEVNANPGHIQRAKDSKNGAKIYASVEESLVGDSSGHCTLHLRGLDIKNVEPGLIGLGRSDPFYVISRKCADHAAGVVRWNAVYRSEHICNHLNPYWAAFTLSLEELCFGDLDWPLKVTVYDYEGNGKHRPIGQFETTLSMMQRRISVMGNADREQAFEIFAEGINKTRGLVVVLKADIKLDDK